jgi:hypothetical protein
MSEQIRSIVEAVRMLNAEQRRELAAALEAIPVSRPSVASGRNELVDSIRGKYRHLPTSSESFINRKRDEVALESQP